MSSIQTITVHGYSFNVETSGFRGAAAEQDRDRAVDALETRLRGMPAATVAEMYSQSRAWVEANCESDMPALLDQLQSDTHAEATRGWYRSDEASISISAA